MTTEILSVIIMVGAVIVFLANRKLKNMQEVQDELNSPEVVNDDAARIRQELEETANEIIERMAIRIDRLEMLLREADRKSNILQKRLEKLERIEGQGAKDNNINDPTFAYLLNEAAAQETIVDLGSNNNQEEKSQTAASQVAEETAKLAVGGQDSIVEPIIPESVSSAVRDSELGRAMREALGGLGGVKDPDTYSIELRPEEVEAYLKARSVDEIPDTPVQSIVDEPEPESQEEQGTASQEQVDIPQEQAAYLMNQMKRK